MSADGAGPRLTAWLAEQRPDISGLRIEGLGRVEFGHSAEMLEPPVRAPRALWIEESGEVLGRPLYVMERAEGQVYEHELPPELKEAPERVARNAGPPPPPSSPLCTGIRSRATSRSSMTRSPRSSIGSSPRSAIRWPTSVGRR